MKMIARLSRVALATAVLSLPVASQAAMSDLSNLVGWSGWTHQLYVGGGAGFQYINLKTQVGNTFSGGGFFNAGFNNHRYAGIQSLSVGLANSLGVHYWAVEFNAYHSSAENNAQFNLPLDPFNGGEGTTYFLDTNMPWRYEVDGVLGYYFQPNILGYAKIGPTMGRLYAVNTQIESPALLGPTGSIAPINKILYGVNFGAGAQYVLNAHWRVGAEADFVQYFNAHKDDAGNNTDGVPLPTASYQFRGYTFIAKATINYLF